MRAHLYTLLASIVAVAAIVAPTSAQLGFDSLGEPVSVEAFTSLSSVPQGGSVKIAVATAAWVTTGPACPGAPRPGGRPAPSLH